MRTLKLIFLNLIFLNYLFSQQITYSEHVAKILYKNCISCHTPNNIGPFSLLTYKDAKRKARTIKKVTHNRYMPPWHADDSYSHLANPLSLSQKDIDIIAKWVDGGCLMGDSTKIPSFRSYLPTQLEKPDLVLNAPKISIKGNNQEKFYYVKIPFILPQKTQICRCEFIPGNTKVVHHMDAFLYNLSDYSNPFDGPNFVETDIINSSKELMDYLKIKNHDGTYPQQTKTTIFDYFPGSKPSKFPKGIYRTFEMTHKGVILLSSLHYGGSSVDTSDASKINLYFCKEKPKRMVMNYSFGSPNFKIEPPLLIPPNTVKKFKTKIDVNRDMSILSIQPHAHLICKSLKAYVITKEGKEIPLLKIDHWDFRWQRVYKFKKMIHIPEKSYIHLEGTYDNTSNNPSNPNDPPKEVKESIRTNDEMLQLWIEFLPYQKGDENISLEN